MLGGRAPSEEARTEARARKSREPSRCWGGGSIGQWPPVGWEGRSQASQGEGHCHQKGCVAVGVAPYGPSLGLPFTRAQEVLMEAPPPQRGAWAALWPIPTPAAVLMEDERDGGARGWPGRPGQVGGSLLTGMMENRMKRQVSSRANST